MLRGSMVGITLLNPLWSEGDSVLSFSAIFPDGTQVSFRCVALVGCGLAPTWDLPAPRWCRRS